jgi:hypothetical protein
LAKGRMGETEREFGENYSWIFFYIVGSFKMCSCISYGKLTPMLLHSYRKNNTARQV